MKPWGSVAAALVLLLLGCSSNDPNEAQHAGGGSSSNGGAPSSGGGGIAGDVSAGAAGHGSMGADFAAPSACKVASRAIPTDAFLVPLAERANLQALLDAHENVRFETGNYATGGPASVTLASGHGLYGNGHSDLPQIVVPAGTTGATVSSLHGPIRFDAAAGKVTADNCFQHLATSVTGKDVALEQNEFLDFHDSSLSFDTQGDGFMRNNRFVRMMLHGGGDVVVRLVGDASHRSYGNVVLWLNALGAPLDTIVGEHQRDLTIVGADGESYGTAAAGAKAMYYTRDIESLRIHTASGRVITPAFDLGATALTMFNAYTSTTGTAPNFTLQPEVDRAALFASPKVDLDAATSPAVRFEGLGDLKPPTLMLNGAAWTTPLPNGVTSAVQSLVAPERSGRPWARPALPPIPDPAGPTWAEGLADQPDDAPMLQQLLDTKHIVELESRAYYLGSALALGPNDGLIGQGADRTVLIAKVPTNDVLTTKLEVTTMVVSFSPTLVDLTLQGGKNGLNVNQPGTQMTISYIDHVTFRNMSGAGIFADHAYGVDNNMFSYVNFYACGSGYKTRTATSSTFDDKTLDLGYTDKTVFYRSQFVACGVGVDIVGRRQNNLNLTFESSFRENTKAAFHSEPDASTIIASSEFIDNHGDPVIETDTTLINSYFRAGTDGLSMLGPSGTVEGTTFERGAASAATVLSTKLRGDARNAPVFYLSNSHSELPLGPIDSSEIIALLVANDLEADAPLQHAIVLNAYDTKGTPAMGDDTHELLGLLQGVNAAPGSQLLFEDAP
jgi:hypothetical protein